MVVDVDQLDNSLVDIDVYTLTEYVSAKPLESNLEVLFTTTEHEEKPCAQLKCGENLKFPFARDSYSPVAVSILDDKELVSADAVTDTKRVVELTLDISALGDLHYDPGDTVAILPSNASKVVAQLLQRLDLTQQADSACHVRLAANCTKKSAKVPAHIPASTTPREIFTHCVALHSVPQKQFLSALASCTSDVRERAFLASLSSKQGAVHYQTLILERGLGLLDLLELCASCKPSLALLIEHLPRLLPRPYSISNSPLEGKQQLRIIYSIRARKPGVTTSMLEVKLKEQPARVFVYPRLQNAFHYTDLELPGNQILIAVGTGLAPFLGFLAHKELCQQQATGQTWLYVGAKTSQAMLKQQQLIAWQKSSVLQRLRMCYSRSSSDDEPKHVQELLEQDAEELVELLLLPKTILYVCADGAKISKSIDDCLRRCMQRVLHLDETEAVKRLKELRTQGKYREDVWL
ncbi:methionine synthase reductase isoform X2 [Drosophila innubila]|uniref:methionine synthase reductase isoform X2 n=1 Tax=Drosophila innubila TaxID=198719 RepID=UPI00148C924F|nr:methionine synthase reductase isoform X2 [Drosophila innubila]